jgi:hypothetical protein
MPALMGGEEKTKDVLDLSESNCNEEISDVTFTPSINTSGFKGGAISRKNDATKDIVVPPDTPPNEGENEIIEV